MLPVSAEVRAGAGADEVDVDIELDTQSRTVTVPADLADALDRDPDARRAFDGLSYSHKQRYALSVESAKTAQTDNNASTRRSANCDSRMHTTPRRRRPARSQ
jgi:hypothetical protein